MRVTSITNTSGHTFGTLPVASSTWRFLHNAYLTRWLKGGCCQPLFFNTSRVCCRKGVLTSVRSTTQKRSQTTQQIIQNYTNVFTQCLPNTVQPLNKVRTWNKRTIGTRPPHTTLEGWSSRLENSRSLGRNVLLWRFLLCMCCLQFVGVVLLFIYCILMIVHF